MIQSDDSGGTVLVVDDEAIQTEILTRVLDGFQVLCANDGTGAVELALRERPDLVLLDVQMPGMDGFQVCDALKSLPETRDIPVIFLTAEIGPASVARAFRAGAVDYVPKPYEFSEIRERVRTHLELRRSREALERHNLALEKTVREQEIDINLARNLLDLIDPPAPRYIEAGDRAVFVRVLNRPCQRQGGDHVLVSAPGGPGRAVISAKDQSGHKVNCVLRSITCDLYHNRIIRNHPSAGLEESLAMLNRAVMESGVFMDDDFFTGMTIELDRRGAGLRFVSAGHPPMILARGDRARLLPEPGGAGNNLPFCVGPDQEFGGSGLELAPGDRIVVYTDGLTALPLGAGAAELSPADLLGIVNAILADHPETTVSDLVRRLLRRLPGGGGLLDGDRRPDDVSIVALEMEKDPFEEEERLDLAGRRDPDPAIDRLVAAMTAYLGRKGFETNPAAMRMAVAEAVLNAWKHGGGGVRVRWGCGNDFNVEVSDRGPGFRPGEVADPAEPANRGKESGRGLFIIRRLAAWTRWSDGGRRITMSFAAADDAAWPGK